MDALREFTAEYAAMKLKMQEESEGVVTSVLREIFQQNPKLHSISWRQYTGYFCDGDPCYFSIGEADINWSGLDTVDKSEDGWDDESDSDFEQLWCYTGSEDRKNYPELCDAQEPIRAVFGEETFGELCRLAFGDHTRVDVTRTSEGIEIETDDYTDHD